MAGLLGDVYSAIDTKKRQIKGLLAEPVETVRQFMFNQNQDAGKNLDLLGQTYQGANGKPSLANMSPKSQAAHDQLAGDLTAAVMGTFVGSGSKTWDALGAKRAQEMTAAGVDPRTFCAQRVPCL